MQSSLFNSLPAPPPRSKCFVAGWGLQLLLVTALISVSTMLPKAESPVRHYVLTSLVRYQPELAGAPQARQAVTPRPRVSQAVTLPVNKAWKVTASVLPSLPRKQFPTAIKVPELKMQSKLPQLPTPALPKVVALNTFSTGSSAMPTTTRSATSVQTGGFGDPEGVSPRSRTGLGTVEMAAVGAFDLPSGSGRGNGAGGTTQGVVASAGFGNGPAIGPHSNGGSVQKAGFDSVYASSQPQKSAASLDPASTPVAILYKPRPAYTEEGRKQGIDGEVRLEVLFSASGEVHVIRVLQGLGYGLDEQAVKAAQQIKFKPALHAGQPVDSTAVVHIIFQLAS